MAEATALKAMYDIDQDRMAAQISTNAILNVLREFIPRACLREAEDKLFEAFFVNGTELTSNTMRKEYEVWKQLSIQLPETMLWPR